jgi:hypothetical protein
LQRDGLEVAANNADFSLEPIRRRPNRQWNVRAVRHIVVVKEIDSGREHYIRFL